MPEFYTPRHEVTVVFRQDTSLIIPPTGLPREARQDGETYEKTLHRLCAEHGVSGSVDRALPRPEGIPTGDALYAYLVEPEYGEVEGSELLVPHHNVEHHLERHVRLSKIDAQLIRSAHRLLALNLR